MGGVSSLNQGDGTSLENFPRISRSVVKAQQGTRSFRRSHYPPVLTARCAANSSSMIEASKGHVQALSPVFSLRSQ